MDGRGRGGRGHRGGGRHHPYKRDHEKPAGLENEKVENKLYVGNLDHRVTEYHLIKLFTPYGKIRHEEYLWHTHGPRRGEPRGYGFVEYSTRQEAEVAKEKMNGRLAFGRPLVVRFVEEKISANNADAPVRSMDSTPAPALPSATKATVGASKSAKIAAIQKKLKLMEEEGKGAESVEGGPGVSGSGQAEPSGLAGRAGESFGGSKGDSDRGHYQGFASVPSSNPVQPRTLLQDGQRWSAWG